MPRYYSNEQDTVLSLETIRECYNEFKDEYDSFSDYLSGCMWWNNGDLTPLSDHITTLRRRLNGFKTFADMDSEYIGAYADEIEELTARIAELETY